MKIGMRIPSRTLFQCSNRPQYYGLTAQISKGLTHYLTAASSSISRRWFSQSRKNSDDTYESSSLSSTRGRAAVGLLPTYLADARAVDRYSPTNPTGALQLGVAESQMLEDWLVPALNTQPEYSEDAIYYQPTAGRDDFKQALAAYIEDLCNLDRGRLKQEGLIVGAGCNAVLENLCFTLADAGDSVLIPTPYYAAFEFDLVARAGLTVQPVTTNAYHHPIVSSREEKDDGTLIDPSMYYPNTAALDAAYGRALEQDSKPKILLISHPMNPLGICYPAETVKECIDWCRERKVHLICDEIYAGSVYGGCDGDFTSALTLTGPELGPYVHWVYALSKDFALSGLRVGAAYTENPEIMVPMQKLNDLCQISSQTQLWTAATLQRRINERELWTTDFRRENHKRLKKRCSKLTAVLDQYSIPYLPPTAGLFVWIDLSRFLPDSDDKPAVRERALYLELVQKFGLLLTPGNSMRNEQPGFFRCVFTAASDDEFVIALQRIEKFCRSKADSR
jgi:aspartate/methionine/tyrosine aminotransferase